MRIIAVTNNKGGVGKTTTVVNLACGLALRGRRVLVIDTDPQANATLALTGHTDHEVTLYDALVARTATACQATCPTTTPGVELIPSTITLSAADIVLAGVPGRERLLTRLLRPTNGYDYILLDSPPSLGILTVNGLAASSEVFIPVGVGTFALMGIRLLEDTIAELRDNLELDALAVTGAIATMSERTRVAQDTLQALQAHFGERLFASVIPKNKDVEEAHSRAMSVLVYAPDSRGAQAYRALTEEVIADER
ncbi:MAG TPA: ParA family protein [Thermomicrobiales bacterium]|nr:ParA family protein [Thermomicrobiales bacterium]